ncbi:hypothetical protein [Streptomyces sp. NPDC055400]
MLAVLGTGVQARSHARAMCRVRPIRQIRVAGRDLQYGRQFVGQGGCLRRASPWPTICAGDCPNRTAGAVGRATARSRATTTTTLRPSCRGAGSAG